MSQRFHLVIFVFGLYQENKGKSKIPLFNPRGGKLLDRPSSNNKLLGRAAFRVLTNIHDGVLL